MGDRGTPGILCPFEDSDSNLRDLGDRGGTVGDDTYIWCGAGVTCGEERVSPVRRQDR